MFGFSGVLGSQTARLGCVRDGITVTVGSDGYTITSTLPQRNAFGVQPVRSATGVWSATLIDNAGGGVVSWGVSSVLASGFLSAQLRPITTVSTTGQPVLHWVFNNAGTPADLPSGGSFVVWVEYAVVSNA